MSKLQYRVENGTRGGAIWGEGQSAPAALTTIDGAPLMAIRVGSDGPGIGDLVILNIQRWTVTGEKPATVKGMRVYTVTKAPPE